VRTGYTMKRGRNMKTVTRRIIQGIASILSPRQTVIHVPYEPANREANRRHIAYYFDKAGEYIRDGMLNEFNNASDDEKKRLEEELKEVLR